MLTLLATLAIAADPIANSSWNVGGGAYTTVRIGTIANIPGLTKGAPYSATVFYPQEALLLAPNNASSPSSFPVVSFAHGTGTNGVSLTLGYGTDLTTLAAYGFIVIGFDSCPRIQCGAAFSTDQVAVLAAVKEHGATLHPSLANAGGCGGGGASVWTASFVLRSQHAFAHTPSTLA